MNYRIRQFLSKYHVFIYKTLKHLIYLDILIIIFYSMIFKYELFTATSWDGIWEFILFLFIIQWLIYLKFKP